MPSLFLKGSDEMKFLGVAFDKQFTFGAQINDLANKVRQFLNVLKVVSHFNWGADRKNPHA